MPIVLIVDDEPQVRELLLRWIGAEGYQMRDAASAEAALEDMALIAADIVLCDVKMPGQSGLWLTTELRARFPESAVILITGDRSIPPHISMQAGVIDYLAKPFTRVEVLDAVQRALMWHRAAIVKKETRQVRAPLTKAWGG